jgi:hypothetical protein
LTNQLLIKSLITVTFMLVTFLVTSTIYEEKIKKIKKEEEFTYRFALKNGMAIGYSVRDREKDPMMYVIQPLFKNDYTISMWLDYSSKKDSLSKDSTFQMNTCWIINFDNKMHKMIVF